MAISKVTSGGIAADIIDGTKIADNAVDTEHLADDAVDSAEIAAGAIDAAHMSANSIDSDSYVDGSIDNAHLADDAVGIAELSATGTASSSTFLRGDNSWQSAADATKLPLAGGTMSGDLILEDNVKIELGNASGGDLQIYHNASNSYVSDQGTGHLKILGTHIVMMNAAEDKNYLYATDGDSVALYHNNNAKLATSATGVTVTGTMSSDAIIAPGAVIQQVRKYLDTGSQITHSGAFGELSTAIRIAITPKHADSYLILEASAWFCSPNSTHLIFAKFWDVTASAMPWMPGASGSRDRIHWAMRVSPDDANDFHYMNMRALGTTGGNTNARTYTVYVRTEGATVQFLESTLSSASGVTAPFVFTITEVGA